jgi:hypothetical protein
LILRFRGGTAAKLLGFLRASIGRKSGLSSSRFRFRFRFGFAY